VANAAPVVGLVAGTPTLPEGGTAAVNLSVADLNPTNTQSVVVDWGDGSAAQPVTLPAGAVGAVGLTHGYAVGGTYTVTATPTNGRGKAGAAATVSLTVTKVAPVVGLATIAPTPDGSPAAVSGMVAAPAGRAQTVTVTWGDGTTSAVTPAAGQTAYAATHTYILPGNYTVSVQAVDSVNLASATVSGTAVVTNVAPSALALARNAALLTDEDVLVVSGAFVDPGIGDTFTAAVDWGDGTAGSSQAVAAGVRTFGGLTHTYAHYGQFAPTVTLTDAYGGRTTAALTEVVRAAPPARLQVGVGAAALGQATTLSGTFDNPDGAAVNLVVSWGDGARQVVPLAAGAATFAGLAHTYAAPGSHPVATAGAADPAPASVYAAQRYGPDFTQTASGLAPGEVYRVRLHFAETYWAEAGKRVFDVAANGRPLLTDFDVFRAAGGADRAVVREFLVPADAAGRVALRFLTRVDNAFVSAVEVLPTVRAAAVAAGRATAAGAFAPDTASGGRVAAFPNAVIDTTKAAGPAPQAVYQTERFGDFSYALGNLAPNAGYSLRLHFAELNPGVTAWVRQFDVLMNGAVVLAGFDIFAAAGGRGIAVTRDIPVAADATGTVTVQVRSIAGKSLGKLNGLELFAGAATVTAPVYGVPSAPAVNLTATATGQANAVGLTGTFAADGPARPFTATVDWGDGSAPTVLILPVGTFAFNAGTHRFAAPGLLAVTVTVADGIAPARRTQVPVAVYGPLAAPALTLSAAALVAGGQVGLRASLPAAAPARPLTVTIDWGDGTLPTTQSLPAGATGFDPGAHTYAAAGNPTVTVTVADAYGNTVSTTAKVAVAPRPTLTGAVVNDGSAQRSRVTSLTVTFAGQVTVGAGAFVLTRTGDGATIALTATVSYVGGQTVVTVTFAGPGTEFGSLADGRYTLKVRGSLLADANGNPVDAGGTGTPGSDYQLSFFRLFGDVSGDGAVNGTDFGRFRLAFGQAAGNPGYDPAFDWNGDGAVNGTDFGQFRSRFGSRI